MTEYEKGKHTVYYHRYHIVWITKYRYKVLTRNIKLEVREIIGQVAEEMNIRIVNGVISSDHLH
ncbi:MAG: IS200/IS605 family transposase, partial [Rickettsia endosymbiont of Glossina mortisans submortisans]|nr:IS200/IS605 family transposase [Rickettsia endosymbiont of Glossina mortisans submortisans]